LFFKLQKLLVKPLTLILWDIVQSVFEQNLRSVILFMFNFKFGELDKEVFVKSLVTKFSQGSFIVEASLISIAVRLFKFGSLDV
jgi:hypothetical protein